MASGFPRSFSYAEEVHVIGVYSGKRVNNSTYEDRKVELGARCHEDLDRCARDYERLNTQFPTRVDVNVTRTGKPLTLVLSAYEATKWRIKMAKGVKIKRIILSGYQPQSLRKNDSLRGVRVEKTAYESGDADFFSFYGDDREVPVGVSTDDSLPCTRDSRVADGYASDFANTVRQLKRRKLVPTTIQSHPDDEPRANFEISNATNVTEAQKIRRSGLCYQNPDGTLSPGHQ